MTGREATHVRPVDRFMPARKAETARQALDSRATYSGGERSFADSRARTEDGVKGVVG